jgi:hypothetical protein
MSGVVVEVRVKENHEIMKGDPLCGKVPLIPWRSRVDGYLSRIVSSERNEGEDFLFSDRRILKVQFRWNPLLLLRYLDISKECSFKKVGFLCCAPAVFLNAFQGDSINQGDLVVEIGH